MIPSIRFLDSINFFSRQLLKGWQRYRRDGIAQLNDVDYEITELVQKKLFTHIFVNISRSSTKKLDYLLSTIE